MIHALDDVRAGFSIDADVVIVGSGAGGAVAAANLARAGLRTVVLEAGPQVRPADMTRDGPMFMAKYYWEGGQRLLHGSGDWPSMGGRCLGGSTVVNSAIMFKLPDWVRREWIDGDGLPELDAPDFDAAFERVFERLQVAPTPLDVQGPRGLMTRDILDHAGLPSGPLPRAVAGCKGSGDCLTGCHTGAKQSVDRSYLPGALEDGAEVYTCCHVDRVLLEGHRAVGVEGRVVDPDGRVTLGRFTVRAPKVVVAAGALQTPVLLLRSGIKQRGQVGRGFQAHTAGFAVGVMDRPMDPWVGATQGWGAFSDEVQGMKYESLWAPTALIAAQWGQVGPGFYDTLADFQRAVLIALVHRSKVTGRVRARPDGLASVRLWVPDSEIHVLMGEVKRVVDSMLDLGAEYVYTGVDGITPRIQSKAEAEQLLSKKIKARDLGMTCNHTFSSCRMSADPKKGVVDVHGKVYGMEGLWLSDASVFPSASAVNPQATVMALSDLITRRIGGLDAGPGAA